MFNSGSTTTLKNGWLEALYYQSGNANYSTSRILEAACSRFGINAVAGFDFYIFKDLSNPFFNQYSYKNLNYNTKHPKLTLNYTDLL